MNYSFTEYSIYPLDFHSQITQLSQESNAYNYLIETYLYDVNRFFFSTAIEPMVKLSCTGWCTFSVEYLILCRKYQRGNVILMSEFVTNHTIDHSIALKLEYDVIMNCRGLIRENTDIVFVKKH